MTKKILYVITKSNWGGAQRYVFDLAISLPKDHFDVKVIFGGNGLLAEKLKLNNIPTLSFEKMWRDINIFEDIKAFFALIKTFKAEKPDIVHLNSSKIGGLGALAARIARVPKIIFTVHGFAFNEDRSPVQKIIIAFISWLTIIFCTDVICIDKTELHQAKRWPFTKKKLHLIYNGINPPEYLQQDVAQKELAQILKVSAGHFIRKVVVGSIAELNANKGLEYAISAIKDLPNVVYIIIGGGVDKDKLYQIVGAHGLEDKVFFAGFVPDAARYVKAFDILTLPSMKEGLPYVLLEAGYAHVPVVASAVGGIPELIDSSSGILTRPRDVKALEKAFAVLSDESQRKAVSETYFEKVSTQFTLDQMVEKTIKAYIAQK